MLNPYYCHQKMQWLMQNQMMRRLMQILILKKNRMIQSRCLFYW